jgi:5'-3' exonuclease
MKKTELQKLRRQKKREESLSSQDESDPSAASTSRGNFILLNLKVLTMFTSQNFTF